MPYLWKIYYLCHKLGYLRQLYELKSWTLKFNDFTKIRIFKQLNLR